MPFATVEKTDTNKIRCGYCRKYHTTKVGVQKCADKATSARASAKSKAPNVPTVAPAPKKKGALAMVTPSVKVPAKKAVAKPKVVTKPVASTTTDEENEDDIHALPPVKPSVALKSILDTIQKPEKEDEAIVWAFVAGITMGRYDYWLAELDEVLSKRLEGMGYNFIDPTAPLRKAHKEATGKAPAVKGKAKPSTLTNPIQLTNGCMTSDYTEDKRGGPIMRGTVLHTVTRGRWNDLWAEVVRENQKTFTVRLLSGPDQGKQATISKTIVKPFYIVTAENAEMKKDVRKGPKVNVKAELEAARAALADTDADDDPDDDSPAVRRVRKVKATKTAPAAAKPAITGKGRRRVMHRG